MGNDRRIFHLILINLIRITLVTAFVYSFLGDSPVIQTVSGIALLFTFLPWILNKIIGVEVPVFFEAIYLMFIYGILMFGEIHGFFRGIWWWSILMSFTSSIVLGFLSLSVVYILFSKNKISRNYIFSGVLIFSFTISMGLMWEIFEFSLDLIIGSGLQRGLLDTMQDLCVNILGAMTVGILGSNYIKRGNNALVSSFFSQIIEERLKSFGFLKSTENLEEVAMKLIYKGESENLEFKSTLRTNVHTKETDKRMELAALKTVTAFMNTKGGNLFIGVDDSGKILGLDLDNFQNSDKASLHLTNLIKTHIGNEFLPFVKFKILNIGGQDVIWVTAMKSKKRVFLKNLGVEEFYVRNGPASVKLEGSSLVDYISHRFKK